jgi:hypothetical protein
MGKINDMSPYDNEDKTAGLATEHLESSPSMLKDELKVSDHVPAGYVPVSAAKDRALNRKLDIALLPFLSLLYLFNGLDRGNVGNAETQGTWFR